MITLDDINEFFEIENTNLDSIKNEYEEMTLEDKIQSGKAIKGLRLDKNFKEANDGDQIRLLHISENLSEFKIGDGVVLQMENDNSYICECSINDFRENGDIEISISPYNYSLSIDTHNNCNLVLTKQNVSMKKFYRDFCYTTEFFQKGYFEHHLINTIPLPLFDGDFYGSQSLNEEIYRKNWGIALNKAQSEAVTKSELTKNYFLIQGPPGTGKSFLLASLVLYGILSKKKIVVVAPTHMAVNNLLLKVAELFIDFFKELSDAKFYITNSLYKCGQSYNSKNLFVLHNKEKIKIRNIQYLNIHSFNSWTIEDGEGHKVGLPMGYVIGMTPYALQSRRAKGLEFDELIIDEAGQMTIPIAMMSLVKYNKVIFAGDHKQLPPIIPENVENKELKHSIFEHLIRDYNSTMLNVSFRMNDVICEFVSSLFYDGKLKSHNGGKRLQTSLHEPIYSSENPIVFINNNDYGRQFSKEESQKAIEIAKEYIKDGISPNNIAILSPFRAQCALMRKMLMPYFTKEVRDDLVIDTVDRMQGQERQIIIYSFTSGDVNYMKKMEDFLFNPNKLNVAFSRAKNKLLLLGNMQSMKLLDNKLIFNILNSELIVKL